MITVKQGTSTNKRRTSLADIYINEKLRISVYQGGLGLHPENDIIIKYHHQTASGRQTQRQPKHIHWVVDLLAKRTGNKKLTDDFLKPIINIWNTSTALPNNSHTILSNKINKALNSVNLANYKALEKYGEYDVEFLFVLLLLFIWEEKNYTNPHYFIEILTTLQNNNVDIYDIVSKATSNYR